jgi:hypothetical protein
VRLHAYIWCPWLLEFANVGKYIRSSVALQPFVGPWPLLQFRNHFYTVCRTPWTSDQPVARPLPTHRINAHTDIHALSGIRTHDPSVWATEDSSCRRPAATVIACRQIDTEFVSLAQFSLQGRHTHTGLSEVIKKLRGFSPQANYTDRATAACRRS